MSPGKISLLAQPAHLIASEGSAFALGVVEALKAWFENAEIFDKIPPRRRNRRHGLPIHAFVGRQVDRVKVIEFKGGSMVCYVARSEPNLYVCTIDVSGPAPAKALIQAASALGAVELITPTFTFALEASFDEIVDVARLSCWGPNPTGSTFYGTHEHMEELSYYRHDGKPEPSTTTETVRSDPPKPGLNAGLATVRWFADHRETLADLALPPMRQQPTPGALPRLS